MPDIEPGFGEDYEVQPSAGWRSSHTVPEATTTPTTPTEPAEPEAVEEVETETIETVTEAPAVETETVEATTTPDDPFAAYGGEENIQQLLTIQQALRSESGIKAIAASTLTRLGVPQDLIPHILSGNITVADAVAAGQQEQGSPFSGIPGFEDYDEDTPLTAADAIKLAQHIAERQVAEQLTPFQQQQEARAAAERQASADTATLSTLDSLLGEERDKWDPEYVDEIVLHAQRYLDPEDWDPRNISAAIRQGYADVVKLAGDRAQQYLQDKRKVKQTVPKSTGGAGGAAGAEPPAVPKSWKETQAQARKLYPELFGR